ncbi:uncharacterized protein LOC115623223 [Scaptodrosophila lebanonensis]|uniref:Uncharacterized protein LOC115623223 n=1 Tax=Drosophila lebanonensis TaxID=7225 RepID=A0A6J2TBB8_DROLE|nr:uncharacterized protein LOC115623223 [Scaptodrosophila lebanonensis]
MKDCKNIVDLNLDILQLIFDQLTRVDQLNLARTHPIFCDAFAYLYREKLFKEVYEFQLPTVEDWRYFLPLCGSGVQSLYTYSCTDQMVELALQFCPKLELISILSYGFSNIQHNLLQIKTLQEIELINFSSQKNSLIELLHELPKLRILRLKNCKFDDLFQIKYLTQLEELEVRLKHDCYKKKPVTEIDSHEMMQDLPDRQQFEQFLDICEPLKKLRSLSINLPHIDAKAIQELSLKCPLLINLELWMDVAIDRSELPIIPKLNLTLRK